MVFYHILNILPLFSLLLAQQDLVAGIESQEIIAERGMVLDELAHTPGKAKLGLSCLLKHLLFNQILDAYQNKLVEYEEIVLHMIVDFHNFREELLRQEAQDANLRNFEQFGIRFHKGIQQSGTRLH